jgi:hypothetical protein
MGHFTYYSAAVRNSQFSLYNLEIHLLKRHSQQTLAKWQPVTLAEQPHEHQFPELRGSVFTFH